MLSAIRCLASDERCQVTILQVRLVHGPGGAPGEEEGQNTGSSSAQEDPLLMELLLGSFNLSPKTSHLPKH